MAKKKRNKKDAEYWRLRALALEAASYETAEQYLKRLEELYTETTLNIQKDIAFWYLRFAKNNKVPFSEAKRMLTSKELKEFQWNVQKYIEYGKNQNLNSLYRKELENISCRVHISRLESLQTQLKHHIEKLYGEEIKGITELLNGVYEEGFYNTSFEISKGLGIGVDLHKYNEAEIEDIIKKPWSADGKNFSERLWGRKKQLLNDLVEKDLPNALIRGESNEKIVERWANKLNADRKAVGRVVRTERAYINSRSALDSYKKIGVEKYQILATLDMRTSDICRDMDLDVFNLSEYDVGVTAPPFHPNCRTTTVPYFEDDFTKDETRAARDENGNTYYVPADMKYEEWYEKYVK